MIYSNDDMDMSEHKSFITEHNASFVVQPTEKKTIVFKIEDVEPPPVATSTSLPDNSNLSRVVDNILETLRSTNVKFTSSLVASTWRKYFETTECKAILSDMFWYCLVKIDKRKHMKDYKKTLLERISYNYIQVFVSVTRFDKDIFFENFYDCIAQGVFYSMFFSYPKSRSRLNSEEFKSKLFEIVSTKLTGINVSSQGYNNWILDLGAGNVLKRSSIRSQENSVNPSALPSVAGKRQTRRTLQQIRYSPLVTRYLHTKRYEAINSVPSWNMRYTLRNAEKEKDIDKKYVYYRKLAVDTERKSKDREKEFKELSSRIRKEIIDEREKYKAEIDSLNARTDEIIKGGPAEYANQLVALGRVQKEEKKQGFIPL